MQPLCDQLTANGEPCQKHAVAGGTRCSTHLGRGGRKTILSEELTDAFVAMLKAGNYIAVALQAVRVSPTTYKTWIRRGREGDPAYVEFLERVEQAIAEGEIRNVAQIATAAKENWQAAAWILERSAPERWGRVSTRLRLPPLPPEETETPMSHDPFSEVDELAAKRRSRSQI